jgi:hypothetical protein
LAILRRLAVAVDFEKAIVWIKWLGMPRDYDRIDVKKVKLADVKPIRSEAAYEAALAKVERLWGVRPGTPRGDRLDVLATLIDAWESEHHPMDPPDPIEAIKFRMEQQNAQGSGGHSGHPHARRRGAEPAARFYPGRPIAAGGMAIRNGAGQGDPSDGSVRFVRKGDLGCLFRMDVRLAGGEGQRAPRTSRPGRAPVNWPSR